MTILNQDGAGVTVQKLGLKNCISFVSVYKRLAKFGGMDA
jgi:hypothetical protein